MTDQADQIDQVDDEALPDLTLTLSEAEVDLICSALLSTRDVLADETILEELDDDGRKLVNERLTVGDSILNKITNGYKDLLAAETSDDDWLSLHFEFDEDS